MDLEKISASIKPRNGWQSIDLGILMVRNWWKTLYGSWFLLTLPIFLFSNLLLLIHSTLPTVLLWWLKPFFESLLLFYISRALFGEFLSVKQTVRGFPEQGRFQMLRYLTYRRFSPFRAFSMPVTQLEKLSGKPRANRITLLLNKVDVQVLGMFMFLVHFEFIILLSFYSLILAFIPFDIIERQLSNLDFFKISQGWWDGILQNLFFYLSVSLIAPFHVAAGFSIYVNRRAVLEGWDIELVFRRIAARHHKKHMAEQRLNGNLKKTTLLIVFFIFALSLPGKPLLAKQTQPGEMLADRPVIHNSATAKQQISDISAGSEFHNEKEITRYTFWDDLFKPKKKDDSFDFDLLKLLSSFFLWVARSIEVILWALFFALVAFIIYKYRSWFQEITGFSLKKKPDHAHPETLFGLDIREKSLPANVPDTVLNLWREGKKREALGLLYRSTLSNLVSKYLFIFNDSHTEQECVQIVSTGQHMDLADYFKTLTIQWQLLAYGHQYPQTHLIEVLCQKWSTLFEKHASEAIAEENQ
ncbi:hypothetical protein KKA14_21715 [bacterium]|nr:hypothetical protein [bacterium]